MHQLSNELLRVVLHHLTSDPGDTLRIDRRAHLSVESFRPLKPPERAKAQDIAHFRLVCRRFAELGIPFQFTCVPQRFTRRNFERLEQIARNPAIASQVKKFAYLVPYFYEDGRKNNEEFVTAFRDSTDLPDLKHFISRYDEQRALLRSGYDARVLVQAMKAFTSLQQVQILSMMDHHELHLIDYIRESIFDGPWEFMDLRWAPACSHATKTLGEALSLSKSPFTVFSGPMMSPQTALLLKDNPQPALIKSFGSRLTCLEIHFSEVEHRDRHRPSSLDDKMKELSPVFAQLFKATPNMQSMHIGFRQRLPLTLRLDEIFHAVQWSHLRIFGIQHWRLPAEDVIGFCRRHRHNLRGLRLRNILLPPGSSWRAILQMLKDEMPVLDWISLRDIGYDSTLTQPAPVNLHLQEEIANIAGDATPTAAVSDDSDDDTNPVVFEEWFSNPAHSISTSEEEDSDNDYEEDDSDDSEEDDDDEDALSQTASLTHTFDSPMHTPAPTTMRGQCICTRRFPTIEDADWGDEPGRRIPRWKRKVWESWVVGYCGIHGSKS